MNTISAANTYLVVVDDTPECRLALRYAARHAVTAKNGRLLLLHVLRPTEFMQWGGVQDAMAQERREEADIFLRQIADDVCADLCPADLLIAEGKTADIVLETLRTHPNIRALVLAASAQGAPGPLIDFFSGEVLGSLPCPLIIVPGALAGDSFERLL